ncbi:MAG: hypothetical protein ACOYXB_11515 [Bacteroidota bacterium]
MDYTDPIVRYLSGSMDEQEEQHFRKQLLENEVLKEEYVNIQKVWHLIEEQLHSEAGDENLTAEERLAELIARNDILNFAGKAMDKKTEKFSRLLSELDGRDKKGSSRRIGLTVFLLSFAALLTGLVFFLFPGADSDKLFNEFYHPGTDEMISNFTRDGSGHDLAVSLYLEGEYNEAGQLFAELQNNGKFNSRDSLVYSLLLYETGRQEEAKRMLIQMADHSPGFYGKSAKWYVSLFLLKENNLELSLEYLKQLDSEPGSYEKSVCSLTRKLKRKQTAGND